MIPAKPASLNAKSPQKQTDALCAVDSNSLASFLLFLHLEILDDQDHRDSAFLLTFKTGAIGFIQ